MSWRKACPEKCASCRLAEPGGLFRPFLDARRANILASCSQLCSYPGGHLIIQQGDPIDGWTVVRKGVVRLFISDADGHEHTVRFAHPGDLIGGCPADSLGEPHGNCYSAEATTPVEVCHFPRGAQVTLFDKCPHLAQAFMDLLLGHLADSYRRLHQLTTTTAEQRLADVLVRLGDIRPGHALANGQERNNHSHVVLRIARQQLADILGVAKETAVRALTTLKERGLVETRGQAIELKDLDGLRRLAQREPRSREAEPRSRDSDRRSVG